MLRQAAPTGLSSRSAWAEVQRPQRGLAEGALADGVQLAARDLQQQLFAAGFPMQPQRPVERDDRGTGRIGVHPDAAAFDAGAAQRHLHQHEILQFVGFDLDFGAVAQGTDRQRAEAAAVQARVDPSAFPGQPVFLRVSETSARVSSCCVELNTRRSNKGASSRGPAAHGCLRNAGHPACASRII